MRRQNFIAQLCLATSFFTFALFPSASHAGILEMKPEEKTIEDVKLTSDAVFTEAGNKVQLQRYVAGLRKKKVAIFWAKVYVGQIFSTPGLSAPKTMPEALETLTKQPVVAITLSFKRDVSTDRMKDAFKESLKENEIDSESTAVKPLFEAIAKSGGMKDKETTTILLIRSATGEESFRFENGSGELQSSKVEPGTIQKILTMWVGKPADSGAERMQKEFLGKTD